MIKCNFYKGTNSLQFTMITVRGKDVFQEIFRTTAEPFLPGTSMGELSAGIKVNLMKIITTDTRTGSSNLRFSTG